MKEINHSDSPETAQKALSILEKSVYFSDIKQSLLASVLKNASTWTLEKGEVLIEQEAPFNGILYILLSGEFNVLRDNKLILKMQKSGQVLGEMSVLTHEKRSAKVIAGSTACVVALDVNFLKTDVKQEENQITAFLSLFGRVLTEKLRLTTEKAKLYEDALLETHTVQEYSHELKKEIQQKLTQIKLYSQAIENNQNAVLIFDHQKKIIHANNTFSLLFGFSQTDLSSLKIDSLFDVPEGFEWNAWKGERTAYKKDKGTFPARVALTPIQTGNKNENTISAYALEFQDISLQKQYEAHLTRKSQELQAKVAELEESKHTANTDALTNVFNRRFYDKAIQEQLLKAQLEGSKCSIILLDVDNFKHYNDTNGHQMGDEVLKGVARVLKENARKTDVVARYGGEEFVLVLPNTTQRTAALIAENIRQKIQDTSFPHEETQPLGFLSASFGVSTLGENGVSSEALLKNADHCLYLAKEQGRNRVVVAKGDVTL